jgi:hypothetical protein
MLCYTIHALCQGNNRGYPYTEGLFFHSRVLVSTGSDQIGPGVEESFWFSGSEPVPPAVCSHISWPDPVQLDMKHGNGSRHFQPLDVERRTSIHQVRPDNLADVADDLSLEHTVTDFDPCVREFGIPAIEVGSGFYQDIHRCIPIGDQVRGRLSPGIDYFALFAGEHFAAGRCIDIDPAMAPVSPVLPERTWIAAPGDFT